MEKITRNPYRNLLVLAACTLAISLPCRLYAVDSAAEKALLAKAQTLGPATRELGGKVLAAWLDTAAGAAA